ncbi:hypothetical protein PI126_g20476 [Phytophthora idaei]|nr:hypothetical protein PI126_g20476 [Phytophthora idaei]
MARQSASTGRSKTLCAVSVRQPLARGQSDPPVVEFALNNAVHVSTGFTPFDLNGMRHPRVPLTLRGGTESSILSGGEARKALSSQVSDLRPISLRKPVESFIDTRLNVINRVRDAMAIAQDRQKEYSDKHGRGNVNVFKVGDLTLLDTRNLPLATVSSVGSNKLKHRFIGPFVVLVRHGASYTIDLPKSMKTHPTFYVGRLKRYRDPQGPVTPQTPQASREEEDPTPRNENQTPSNVQRRKAKTHVALVDREASGTPEGLRTVEPSWVSRVPTIAIRLRVRLSVPVRVRLRPRCQVTKGTPDLLKLAESLINIGRGRPATNPIMESRDLPAQLVQAVLELREDPAIPGLGDSITTSPETQSDLEDKNALTEMINLRVLRLSHSRKRCTQPGGAPRRRCLVLEVERGSLHLSSTVMERPTTTWSGSSASGALMESASSW